MLKLKQKEKDNKVDEVAEKILTGIDIKAGGTGSGSKLHQILNSTKGGDENNCPTCGKGHIHHEGGVTKCSNGECGTEFVHVPKMNTADYMCTTCHAPHRKPISKELQDSDICPQCGGNDFKKFDWSKIGIENRNKK